MDARETARVRRTRFRTATRVLSMLAVAGSLVTSLGRTAVADGFLDIGSIFSTGGQAAQTSLISDPTIPLRMDFFRMDCQSEQGDGVFDLHSEPYVVIWAADLQGATVRTKSVYKLFGDVDSGETHYANPVTQVYNFDGAGSPIVDPDKVIFLAAVLENDDPSWRANDVRNRVQQDLLARLLAYRSGGLSRDTIVSRLQSDMSVAINAVKGGDDWIGYPQEIRLTANDLVRARAGTQPQVTKTLSHQIGSAKYSTTYVLQTTNIVIN